MPTEVEPLRELVVDLDAQLRLTSDHLSRFWNDRLSCFSTSDPAATVVNVTSTCFALGALQAIPEAERQFYLARAPRSRNDVQAAIRDALLDAPWTSEVLPQNNVYTNPIALSGVLALGADVSDPRLTGHIDSLLANTDDALAFPEYPPNAFLTYWATRASISLLDASDRAVVRRRVRRALRRHYLWSEREIHRQIASHAIGDVASFDSSQLAYSVAIYTIAAHAIDLKPRADVLEHAVSLIFDAQLPDGLWPKGGPIFHLPQRGSIYSFTFEMLDVLLSSPTPPGLFTRYLPKLRGSIRWATDNIRSEPNLGTQGWRSNHLVMPGGPEVWSTATVFATFMRVRSLASQAINTDLARQFVATPNLVPNRDRLDGLLDSHLNLQGKNRSLRTILDQHFIAPRLGENRPGVSTRKYSAILFGPPGTAKTTIAGAIASALGWPFFHIQTGHFLEEGNERVAASARTMFTRRLGLLENAVVLFDEIEEFIREREDNSTETASKLITTSMLTLIQQLRREERIIFFVATNRLKEIDSAIRRPGRFDMLLLVQPPSRPAKLAFLRSQLRTVLADAGLGEPEIASIIGTVDTVVSREFDDSLRFFSFAEWQSLTQDIVQSSRQSAGITEVRVEQSIARRSEHLLISGDVRRTFLECERESVIY